MSGNIEIKITLSPETIRQMRQFGKLRPKRGAAQTLLDRIRMFWFYSRAENYERGLELLHGRYNPRWRLTTLRLRRFKSDAPLLPDWAKHLITSGS